MKTINILLFLILLDQNCVSQYTWYVSNTGSNLNTGQTSNSPFKDISHALTMASCGDSLYIISGTYHEKIQATAICPENNRIIIQGDTNEKPLIIGDSLATNKYAISALGSGYYFRNFKMTSPYPEQCSQSNQVIVGLGDHFTFDDIIVFNSGYDGIKTYGDCNSNNFAINWKIINSEIYNCGQGCPASIVNGDGIDFTQCRGCLIENTIIRDNKGHQLQIKLEAKNVRVLNSHIEGINMIQIGLPGTVAQCDPLSYNADSISFIGNVIIAKGDTSEFIFKLADVRNLKLYNNTIVKDNIDNINIGFICFGGCTGSPTWTNTPSAPVEIKNNIFASFANAPFEYGTDTTFFDPFNILGTEVTMDYNLFYDSNSQITVPIDNGTNSIVAAPLFCDYPNSFDLNGNSPCIDAGDPSLPSDSDNSQNDIGARYFQTPCGTNSIREQEPAKKLLNIYPNPSNGEFNIKSNIDGTFRLMNTNGQEVLSERVKNGINYFDINEIGKDIYIILIEDQLGIIRGGYRLVKY